jgi:glyoxylase-like metal-dependent hydrolase (beta-lactamase superfamily II)
MRLDRREFVVLSALGFVGLLGDRLVFAQQAPAGAAPAAPTIPEFKDVRRNVGVFTARGGTIGYLVTPDAVVVVDSQYADTAPMFLSGLHPKTSRKIDLLINSHHHPDHTGGNKVMQPNVGKIVAHVNVPGLQKKQAAQMKTEENQAYADTTFDKDWKMAVGKETVSARYYGAAHTSGDIAISFESANVVHLGDLMSYQRNPRADRPAGASVPHWIPVLENVVKDHSNDTIYIFGHSKAGERVTGSRNDLMDLRNYLTALVDYAKKQIAAGKSQEEIMKTPAIPGFESYEGTPVALEAAYLVLSGKV